MNDKIMYHLMRCVYRIDKPEHRSNDGRNVKYKILSLPLCKDKVTLESKADMGVLFSFFSSNKVL